MRKILMLFCVGFMMLVISSVGVNRVYAENSNKANELPDTGNSSLTYYIVPAVLLTITVIAKKSKDK